MEAARAALLRADEALAAAARDAGYDAEAFTPRYHCPLCGDTGMQGGNPCSCVAEVARRLRREEINAASPLGLCQFASFEVKRYSDAVEAELGISPQEYMGKLLNYCRNYAARFSQNSPNLLFMGHTGLGKTHLALAIADAVLEGGHDVLYTSAAALAAQLGREHFDYSNNDEWLAACQEADLLILDDLGTEYITPLTISVLYELINTRMLTHRPTIYTTNITDPVSYTHLDVYKRQPPASPPSVPAILQRSCLFPSLIAADLDLAVVVLLHQCERPCLFGQVGLALGLAEHDAAGCHLGSQQRQHRRHRVVVERWIEQCQIERSADVGEEAFGLALTDVALAVDARRLAVGFYDSQRLGGAVDEDAAFCPAGQCLDAQLSAAREQVEHPRPRHKKLHAGEHGLLHTIDGRAGNILARQRLQVFAAGCSGDHAHHTAPLSFHWMCNIKIQYLLWGLSGRLSRVQNVK